MNFNLGSEGRLEHELAEREKGKKSAKTRDQEETENRAALLVQQNFLLENAGVSHRVHPSTQSTGFLCLLPPLFSNVSTWKSCFSPQTSVNFPSLQKKKKKERKHSPNKEDFWIFKSGILHWLYIWFIHSKRKIYDTEENKTALVSVFFIHRYFK